MDFEELLLMLSEGQAKFIVVGGVACALNGFVRATDDLGILIEASNKNITQTLEILKKWGKGYADELEVSDFPVSAGAIRIIEDFPLDIFENYYLKHCIILEFRQIQLYSWYA